MPVCPTCDNVVDEGVAICDRCDTILDDSFLNDDAGGDGGDEVASQKTGVVQYPQAPAARKPSQPPRPAPAPARPSPSRPSARAMPEEREDTADEASPRKPAKKPDQWDSAMSSSVLSGSNEILDDTWKQFLGFPFEERLTIVAGFALLVLSLMPWRVTEAYGYEIGVFADAWPAAVFGLGTVVLVWARLTSLEEPWLSRARLAQWVASLGGVAIAAWRMYDDFDRTVIKQLRGPEIWRSKPIFFIVGLAAIASLMIGVGTMLAKKAESAPQYE